MCPQGGPLMLEIDSHWVQLGIVSFGNRCGEPSYPGVSRIMTFRDVHLKSHFHDPQLNFHLIFIYFAGLYENQRISGLDTRKHEGMNVLNYQKKKKRV